MITDFHIYKMKPTNFILCVPNQLQNSFYHLLILSTEKRFQKTSHSTIDNLRINSGARKKPSLIMQSNSIPKK